MVTFCSQRGLRLKNVMNSILSSTNMFGMFQNSLFNQPIRDWDVSHVTEMNQMFKWNHHSIKKYPIGVYGIGNLGRIRLPLPEESIYINRRTFYFVKQAKQRSGAHTLAEKIRLSFTEYTPSETAFCNFQTMILKQLNVI